MSPAAAPSSAQTQALPSGDEAAAALEGLEPDAVKQLLIEVQTLILLVLVAIVCCNSAHRVASTAVAAACTLLGNAAQQVQRLAQVQT